jgi:hypothetical protein
LFCNKKSVFSLLEFSNLFLLQVLDNKGYNAWFVYSQGQFFHYHWHNKNSNTKTLENTTCITPHLCEHTKKDIRWKSRVKKFILWKKLEFFKSGCWNVVPPPNPNFFT